MWNTIVARSDPWRQLFGGEWLSFMDQKLLPEVSRESRYPVYVRRLSGAARRLLDRCPRNGSLPPQLSIASWPLFCLEAPNLVGGSVKVEATALMFATALPNIILVSAFIWINRANFIGNSLQAYRFAVACFSRPAIGVPLAESDASLS
ncbi:hypothetical protein BKD09_41790 [Bradyrhizobium japonicum]|uniref:Uncharacterized protein n=1 Tax=Bradyrhizobium japonicum TaxID=375 RepID=A0A1L3FNQ6_BRAJP|nr:hypothetical protein BKD09_41790 [Bradyrhizobium japonicum]